MAIEEGSKGSDGRSLKDLTSNIHDARACNYGDHLFLQSSDHPWMVLLFSTLTGNDYLSWSCSMKIVLGTKVKLGFTNGKCETPTEDSPAYEQWFLVDYMVSSWILNSIPKDIIDAFLYITSTNIFGMNLRKCLESVMALCYTNCRGK